MLRSYRGRLLLAFLAVTLASLALFAGLTAAQVVRYSRQARAEELRMRLKLVSNWLDPGSPAGQEALHSLSAEVRARWQVAGEREEMIAAAIKAVGD